jgi:iron complex transport system substrate-binding protein
MSCGSQSSGSEPWGFFILRRIQAGLTGAVICTVLVTLSAAWACESAEWAEMKRRQQGILTGMPFMAHVSQRSFVDDLGRRLFLAKAPSRIVSLAPSLTEILFAIGAGSQVAGVTEFCDYPAEAQAKPKVGYSRPNLESIVSLQPDLIVAPRDFLQSDVIAKLDQLNIPVFILQARTVEDIAVQITTLGRMLERPAAGNDLADQVRRRLNELRDRTRAWPKRRVLYVLNSEPLTTVGPDSYIHQLLTVAGGENVAARASAPYPRLSMEEVLRQDPEVLLFPVGKFEAVSEEEQRTWHRWGTMTAVKHNRLAAVPTDLINRPGPRIIEGLEALARAIHPEAFAGSESP